MKNPRERFIQLWSPFLAMMVEITLCNIAKDVNYILLKSLSFSYQKGRIVLRKPALPQ